MLLTLKPPLSNGIKSPNDYFPAPQSRYTPPAEHSLPSFSHSSERRMSNPHRGLPPPASLTLPAPDRSVSSMSALGQLPAPPAQWAPQPSQSNQDDSMRSWLQAKVEEDRRRQEEERTKQEGLRLDQRKIEQGMLRDSLGGGIPPYMVPLIFAGMGGAALSEQSLQWAQHAMSEIRIQSESQQRVQQHAQAPAPPPQSHQIQHNMSPDMRRDNRMIPPNPYGTSTQSSLQSQQLALQTSQPNLNRQLTSGPTSAPRSASGGSLSRLNTGEMHISQPPSNVAIQPLQQSSAAPQESSSSTGIYFHHYVPPGSGNNPPTPSGKSNHGSPYAQSANSHLRSEYKESPKKRKNNDNHRQHPPPQSQLSDSSPRFSQRSSQERNSPPDGPPKHNRQPSDHSGRGYDAQSMARPSSRQQRQEHHGGYSYDGVDSSKRPTPVSSSSTSMEGPSIRAGETRQSPYLAGPSQPEMREYHPKRE